MSWFRGSGARSGGGRGGGGGRGSGRGPGRMGGSQAAGTGGYCVCPNCGHRVKHTIAKPCFLMKCPECGSRMTRE